MCIEFCCCCCWFCSAGFLITFLWYRYNVFGNFVLNCIRCRISKKKLKKLNFKNVEIVEKRTKETITVTEKRNYNWKTKYFCLFVFFSWKVRRFWVLIEFIQLIHTHSITHSHTYRFYKTVKCFLTQNYAYNYFIRLSKLSDWLITQLQVLLFFVVIELSYRFIVVKRSCVCIISEGIFSLCVCLCACWNLLRLKFYLSKK